MQFFSIGHLPKPLQIVAQPFCELAQTLVANLPSNPSRADALQKLLEAKEAALRTAAVVL